MVKKIYIGAIDKFSILIFNYKQGSHHHPHAAKGFQRIFFFPPYLSIAKCEEWTRHSMVTDKFLRKVAIDFFAM